MPKSKFDAFYYGIGMKLDEASVDEAGKKLEGKLNKVVDNVAKNLTTISEAVAKGVKDVDTKKLVQSLVDAQKELNQFQNFDPSKLQKQIDALNTTVTSLSTSLGDVGAQLKSFTDDVTSRLSNIEIKTSKQGRDALKSDLKEMKTLAQGYSRVLASGEKIDTSALDRYFQKIRDGFASLKASGNPMEMFADKELANYFIDLTNILRQMGAPVEDLRADFFELSSAFKGVFEKTNASGAQTIFKNTGYQIEAVNAKLRTAQAELARYEAEMNRLQSRSKTTGFDIVIDDDKSLGFEAKIARIQQYGDIIAELDYGEEWATATRNQIALIQAAEKELQSLIKKPGGEKALEQWTSSFGFDLTDKFSSDALSEYVRVAQVQLEELKSSREKIKTEIAKYQSEIGRLTATEAVTSSKKDKRTQKTSTQKQKATGVVAEVEAKIKINEAQWAQTINAALANLETKGKVKPFKIKVEATQGKILEEVKKIKDAALVDKKKDGSSDVKIFNDRFQKFYDNLKARREEIVNEMKTNWHPALKDAFAFRMELLGIDNKSLTANIGEYILTTVDVINDTLSSKPLQFHTNLDTLLAEIQTKVQDIKIDGNVTLGAGNVDLSTQNLGDVSISLDSTNLAREDTLSKIYNLLSVRKGGGDPKLDGRIAELRKAIAAKESEERKSLEISRQKVVEEKKGTEEVKKKVVEEKKGVETAKKKASEEEKTATTSTTKTKKSSKKKGELTPEEIFANRFANGKEVVEYFIGLAKLGKNLNQIREIANKPITADMFNDDELEKWVRGKKYTKADVGSYAPGKKATPEAVNQFLSTMGITEADLAEANTKEEVEFLTPLKKYIYAFMQNRQKLNELLTTLTATQSGKGVVEGYNAAQSDKTEYLAGNLSSTIKGLTPKKPTTKAQLHVADIFKKYNIDLSSLPSAKTYAEQWQIIQQQLIGKKGLDFNNLMSDLGQLKGNVGKTYENFMALLQVSRSYMETSNLLGEVGREADLLVKGRKEKVMTDRRRWNNETGQFENVERQVSKTVQQGIRGMLKQLQVVFENKTGRTLLGYNLGKGYIPDDAYQSPSGSFTSIIKSLTDALNGASKILFGERMSMLDGSKDVGKWTPPSGQSGGDTKPTQTVPEIQRWIQNTKAQIQSLDNLSDRTDEQNQRLDELKTHLANLESQLKASGGNLTYTRGGKEVTYDQAVADLPRIQSKKQNAEQSLADLRLGYDAEHISFLTDLNIQRQSGAITQENFDLIMKLVPKISDLNKQLLNGSITQEKYIETISNAYALMRKASTDEAKNIAKLDAKKLADTINLVKAYQEEEKTLQKIIKTQKGKTSDENKQQKVLPVSQTKKKKIESETSAPEERKKVEDIRKKVERDTAENARLEAEKRANEEKKRTEEAAKQVASEKKKTTESQKQVASEKTETQESKKQVAASQEFENSIKQVIRDLMNALSGEQTYKISGGRITPTPEQMARYKAKKDNALNSLMSIFGVESKDINAFAQSILPKNAAFRNGFGASGKTINSIYGNLMSQYGEGIQNPDQIVREFLDPVKQVLNKEVTNLFSTAHKIYQEAAFGNTMFRELSFGAKNGVVTNANLGLTASVFGSGGSPSDTAGHFHPRNSMYSSDDYGAMASLRKKNSSYNKDVLITPDYIYQLTNMSKVEANALLELKNTVKSLENGKLGIGLTTKANESLLHHFAKENGLSFSKSTYDADGNLTDITSKTPIIDKESLELLIQYAKELNNNQHRTGDTYKAWQKRKQDLEDKLSENEIINSLMLKGDDAKRKGSIYSNAYHDKARSSTLIQEAVDYDFDMSLFIQQFKDLFNAMNTLGEKPEPQSALMQIKKHIQELDNIDINDEKYAELIEKIKSLAKFTFGSASKKHIDDNYLSELREIAQLDKSNKITKTIVSEASQGRLREAQYRDSDVGNMTIDEMKAELSNLTRMRDEGEVDPRFATAEKQDIIINLLKNGIKVSGKVEGKTGSGGKKSATKTPTIPSTGKADTQFDTISQLDGLNTESALYKRYMGAKSQLNDALNDAKAKGKNFTIDDANKIKALSTEVTKLGRKIIEASSSLEQFKSRGGQAFTSTANEAKTLKDEMLELAYQNASTSKMLLSDVSYDEVTQKMTYSLTDLEGNVTKVSMAYNDLFGSILTMSNKTTNSVGKIYKTIEGEMTNRIGVNDIVSQTPIFGESNEYKTYLNAYNAMMDAQDALRVKGELATKEEKDNLISLTREVANTRGEFERLVKASAEFDTKVRGGATETLTYGFDMSSLSEKMKEFVLNSNNWTQAQKAMIEQTWNFKDAQNGATYSVVNGKKQLSSMSVIFDEGTRRIGQYTIETKKYQTGFEKFMDSLKGKWQEVARYLMSFGSLYRVWAVLRQGVQYVREIDSALTELKKVTDETEETYDRFLNTAAKTADKIGSTIKEIVSSTADWARIGYSLEDATTLAESTAVLLNVSEFQSIDDATSALTSTLQAFGYTANQSMEVVDVMNEVGNNFAISSDGIATALQDSASSLMAANNSYQESVALIAAANRVVQDPNSVGAALRTISLRLRGTSTEELEEAGEDTDGAITSKSKLRSKIKGYTGIDILTDSGAYKSTYEILLEISKVWDSLTDMDRAGLLEMIAGKTRSNTAAAILSNTKDLEKAYESAMKAEGSAYAENEKYLDSIQGRIDLFNNSVQTMWNNALDSDVVKGVVDFGTTLIKIVDTIGLIPSIITTIGLAKIIPSILKATMHVDTFGAVLQTLAFGAQYANSSIGEIILTTSKASWTAAKNIPTWMSLGKELGGVKGAALGLADGLSNLWKTIPVAGKIMLIVAAVAAVVAIVDACTTSTKEFAEKLEETKSELYSIQSELSSLNSELETTKSRIEELLDKPSLSFTEKEELNNLQQQNDELERQVYLLEQRQKRKQKEAEDNFVDTVSSDLESYVNMMGNTTSITTKQNIEFGFDSYQAVQEELRIVEDDLIQAEKTLENAQTDNEKERAKKDVKKAEKEYEKKKKEADAYYNYINGKIEEYSEYADGIDYAVADDDTKEFLDYIYNLEDRFNILNGGDKSYAIKRIFNKEEFDDLYNSLEGLQEKLRANPDDTNIVSQIKEKIENSDIEDDLHAVGLEVKDAINYWTMLGSQEDVKLNAEVEVDYEKISNAIDEIQNAYSTLTDVVEQYNSTGYLTLDNLQALLSLEPEYLAVLQMENGQLSINQQAMETLLQTQLAKAEATVVDTAITQLNALSEQAKMKAVEDSAAAMSGAIPTLGAYASELSKVGQEALIASGKLSVLAEATNGAIAAGVDPEKIQAVFNGMDAQFAAINSVRTNLPKNFGAIVSPKTSGSSSKDKDDAFQKAMDYWENRIGANQARYEQIQNEIDLLESQGKKAGAEYYEEQIKLENERLFLLQQQKAEAQSFLGTFTEGSEEWWEVANTLNDIESEIDDVTASIQDLNDAIAEVNWYGIEEPLTRFDNHTDTVSNIRDLLAPNGEEDWFDDEGMWTEKGVAVAGTYIQEIAMDEESLKKTQETLDKLKLPYEGNEEYYKSLGLGIDSEQDLYDKREEYQKKEQEYAKNIQDNQQAIVDMYETQIDAVEEWTNEAIEAYHDYIDVVKEALDAERDLYEFKKDVEKQTKDIASLERRIASLSGSDNAADIAERRKLEAELYDAREGLNDTYYNHTKDAQQQALEDEAAAYEESMNKFIEGLRTSLETALLDMDLFMQGVFSAVTANAPAILDQYNSLGLSLDSAIIDPWEEAAKAITSFGGVDGLGMMNAWITEGGIFPIFKTNATEALKSPWTSGATAAQQFQTSVAGVMSNVVGNIKSNVETAKSQLSSLYSQIQDTNTRLASVNTSGNTGSTYTGGNTMSASDISALQTVLKNKFHQVVTVDGKWGPETERALIGAQNFVKNAGISINTDGKYTATTRNAMITYMDKEINKLKTYGGSSIYGQAIRSWTEDKNRLPAAFHAKGTLGTKRDELAITDESWIGDEITLAAGKNGQLQYLKKGSAVMPADISANLVEWGKLNPKMMTAGVGANINMISNAINKPKFKLDIENFLRCDNVSQDTLPDLKRFVNEKMNSLMKQLNYSLKKSGAR